VANKTMAYGKPDDNCNDNNDSQDNQLHFHVLKPHLAPQPLPLPLENISLPTNMPPTIALSKNKNIYGHKLVTTTP
jgi:hypothetical protein